MRVMSRLLGALIVLGSAGLAAEGSSCRQRVVVQQVQEVQVERVLRAEIVAIPAYQVTYAPASSDVQAILQRMDRQDAALAQALGRLEAVLAQALKVQPGAVGEPKTSPKAEAAPAPLSHEGILRAKCASCHDPALGKVKGGLALFNGGKLAPLSDRQLRKVLSMIVVKRMPPKDAPDLSDGEYQELMRWMDSLE